MFPFIPSLVPHSWLPTTEHCPVHGHPPPPEQGMWFKVFNQVRSNNPQRKSSLVWISSEFWWDPTDNCSIVTKETVEAARSVWVLGDWDGKMALETLWATSDTKAKLSQSYCWRINRNARERSVGREKAFRHHHAACNLTKDTQWS